jgi:hypothetical protein
MPFLLAIALTRRKAAMTFEYTQLGSKDWERVDMHCHFSPTER